MRKRCPTAGNDEEKMRAKEQKKKKGTSRPRTDTLVYTLHRFFYSTLPRTRNHLRYIQKRHKNAKSKRSKEWLLIIGKSYVYIICYIKHFESP